MRKPTLALTFTPAATCLLVAGLSAQGGKVDFVKEVAPIFVSRCVECHGAKDPEADLRLDVKAGLFHATKEDWVVLPGKPKESVLYERIILPADDDEIMPADGKPLTKEQIDVIRRWIEQGAPWPEGADAAIAAIATGGRPVEEKLALPALTAAEKAAEDKAVAAIEKAGGLAMRIAADTTATEANFSLLGAKATNETVALTADLSRSLIRLNLARTKIDDGALDTVAGHKLLRWLNLSNTAVTDDGLGKLAGLSELRYLNLYGTGITDAGLAKLASLKQLSKLYLWQSKATKAGADKLRAVLPKLRIDMGEYAAVLAEVKPVPVKQAAKPKMPINTICPITGKKVAPGKTSVFEGQVIGLCCAKCKARFDSDPAAAIGKVAEFKVATGGIANGKCPVSGEGVAEAQTVNFRGKVIGLCCAKCKAAFLKDPEKYLPKLTDVFPVGKPDPAKSEKPSKKPKRVKK